MADEKDKVDPADTGETLTAHPEIPGESKAAETTVQDTVSPAAVDTQEKSTKTQGTRISVSLRTLLVTAVVVASVASAGVMTWLYLGERSKLDAQSRQAADNTHAEQVALDYAVAAAKINYQDLDAWKKNLVKGTTGELTDKLNDAGKSMEQILVPLQWNSDATPLMAKVRSNDNGIYVVDAFVGVQTKTVQAPEGLQSTATYSITVDGGHNWQISEVGGIGSVVGRK